MLALLHRVFSSVTCISSKRLFYVSLVRCHLMYCFPLWRPQFIADIKQLESVQRRATRFIVSNCHLSYKKHLALLPLMMQFEIANILFFVKLMKNPNCYSCFPMGEAIECSHPHTLACICSLGRFCRKGALNSLTSNKALNVSSGDSMHHISINILLNIACYLVDKC